MHALRGKQKTRKTAPEDAQLIPFACLCVKDQSGHLDRVYGHLEETLDGACVVYSPWSLVKLWYNTDKPGREMPRKR